MKYYLAILLTLLVVLAACAPETVPEAPAETAPAETTPVEETAPVEELSAKVEINRREFVPEVLTIKVGTTVTWINNDEIGHTVQFYGHSKLNGIVPQGKTHEVVFTEAGEYDYINAAVGVKAKVIVEE